VYGADGTRRESTLPVLFLHGNGEEHGIFGVQINGLVGDGRCAIGVDSRAQGASTRGRAPLTYELMTADALVVLDALGVQRVHVVGFSDGAIEALIIARDHPERVVSVLSMGANLTPEGVLAGDDWDMEGTAKQCESWAAWLGGNPKGVDPSIVTPSAQAARTTAELMRLMLDEPHIPAESLGAIHCPVTVMTGEFDCIDPAETQRIVDAIPGARKVVIPGADHVLPKCAPDDVNRELFSLLRLVEANPC
jgi:pimeloyl-ACP methyl ester carboxylesterase